MRKFEVKIQKIQENSITISARDKKEALELFKKFLKYHYK